MDHFVTGPTVEEMYNEDDYIPEDVWEEAEQFYDEPAGLFDAPPPEEYEIKWV